MDSNNCIHPFWCVIRCMYFFQLLRVYFQWVFDGVSGGLVTNQAVESFVHIINEDGAAAAVVILHSRLHTPPLFRRHMMSSWKYAVAMVKYSIIKAPRWWQKADLSFHTMVGGPCLFCHHVGALVIDLIFTSKSAMVKAFVLWFALWCVVDHGTGGKTGDIPLPDTSNKIICV